MPAGREAAEQVAKEAGSTLDEGEIIPGSNFYHFSCHHVRRRSTEPHAEVSLSQLLEQTGGGDLILPPFFGHTT